MMQRQFDAVIRDVFRDSGTQQEERGTVLLAVSGGIDSMCMADLALHSSAGVAFAVAHCNFHLRAAESDSDAAFGYGDYVKVLNFEKLNSTTLCHLVKSFNHLKSFYLETYDNVVEFTAPETWYSNHPEDADYVEEFELWDDDYEIEILSYLWSLIESNLESAVIKLPTGNEDNIYLINSGYGETNEELIAALNEYSDFDHPLYEADSYYDI